MPVPQKNLSFVEQAGKPVADNNARYQYEPTFFGSYKTHPQAGLSQFRTIQFIPVLSNAQFRCRTAYVRTHAPQIISNSTIGQ